MAAISGPCVGGGCELVLACTHRLISDNKSSQIGLPEIKLGILPGFGGTQRLPRLVGISKALDIILAGKILRPQQAAKCGLVNEVVAYHGLLARAESIATGNAKAHQIRLPFMERLLTFSSFGRSIVRKKASAQVLKETKGFYPAPPAALEAVLYGLTQGLEAGLALEAKELSRLICSRESKCLTRLFFLTEASKGIGKGAKKAAEQIHGVVVGAGVMGAGIAFALARNQSPVILKDANDAALQRGMEHIKKVLGKLSYITEQERSFILNRIEPTTKDSLNIGNANFAIEAVFEDLTLKKKILSEMAATMQPESIIATNTSSLSVTEIAAGIPSPERVVGMHFFNPVEKMPLIEIVRGAKTSDKVVAVIAALTTKLGKFPIVVNDVPGFLVNRILTPYLAEAAWALQDGYSLKDIDAAATTFGMPMGPLRLLDEVGLDVASHVSEIMVKGYGERMQGPGLSDILLAGGRKGKKIGGGFYDYSDSESTPWPGLRDALRITEPERSVPDLRALQDRLILRLVNEAILCLDEGVAGAPGADAANQVDLGSVMGFGFPPFHGGVLFYAQSVGAKVILDKLSALEKELGSRFAPCRGIAQRVASGRGFLERAE
ncbi:MAG: fatty acid oxidation complex subunit alpha FadJ [Proteobacteria bacterium]|nr:fatty acid oxidation complex subunit alpha FadJ [Pseudomonadota bacterium]